MSERTFDQTAAAVDAAMREAVAAAVLTGSLPGLLRALSAGVLYAPTQTPDAGPGVQLPVVAGPPDAAVLYTSYDHLAAVHGDGARWRLVRLAPLAATWPPDLGLLLNPGTGEQFGLSAAAVRTVGELAAGRPVVEAFALGPSDRWRVLPGAADETTVDDVRVARAAAAGGADAVVRAELRIEGLGGRLWPVYVVAGEVAAVRDAVGRAQAEVTARVVGAAWGEPVTDPAVAAVLAYGVPIWRSGAYTELLRSSAGSDGVPG
ncbi:SseB family protein [Catellatospora tritici]|uniref:SseB family protein n=1 Tax=Catellatospora tritici TaxID=2851566 RepID=UPI001C2CDAA3|nr:SseB family protein [Catellatospora tritici]MBV1853557.1 SseB family protein [Catellatospora tritici]